MRLLFIGGCERSGTSLVQKLLCIDRRVTGIGELVYTGRIARLYAQMAADHAEPWAERLAGHFADDELAGAFRRLVRDLLASARAAEPHAEWLVEKTPSNIFAFAELAQLFPEARFIHVLRDGRDVLASHHDVRQRYADAGRLDSAIAAHLELPYVTARWRNAVAAHHRTLTNPDLAERYLLVRYEQLAAEPASALASLGDFLGLKLDTRAREPDGVAATDLGLPIDGLWTTENADRRGFAPERIGRWQQQLSPLQRLRAQLAMAPALEQMGYRVARGVSALARLTASGRAMRRT